MSFALVHPYFQSAMSAVDSEFKEWEDAFSIDNIPASIIDRSWHFRFFAGSYTGSAHTCLGFNVPVQISLVIKGYRNPKEAIDTAAQYADAIVQEVCKPSRRLNQVKIKNVLPSTVSIRELGQSNDNVVVLEIQFVCSIFI